MDFVHDQLATGHKLRILTVIDKFTRFVPIVDTRLSYKGENVVQTLEKACRAHGYPKNVRVDNGPGLISKDLNLWAYQNGVTLDFSRSGKPTDNAFIESFNGSLRAECLNTHWFLNLAEARQKLEAWQKDYNEVRPLRSLVNKSPIMLINHLGEPSPPQVVKPENSSSDWG